MEEWSRWEPIKGVSGKFFVDVLTMTEDGLLIKLSNWKNSDKIEIAFNGLIDAYRYTNDSFCFKIPSELSKRYPDDFYSNWTFFKVTHSDYLKWLSEKSATWSNEFDFVHFCIIGGDEIVDILARYEPDVKIIT